MTLSEAKEWPTHDESAVAADPASAEARALAAPKVSIGNAPTQQAAVSAETAPIPPTLSAPPEASSGSQPLSRSTKIVLVAAAVIALVVVAVVAIIVGSK